MCNLGQQIDNGLRNILTRAVQETEYYRMKTVACELSEYPFLTRQIVQRQHSCFLCDRYQRYPDIEHLLLKRSFGTSGVPLEVYWDSRDEIRAQALLWEYRKARFGITADEKCCIFRTAEYAGNKIMDDMPKRLSWEGKTLSFSMRDLSAERLQECIDTIFTFDPVWMILPPSIALLLAETMKTSKQLPPSGLRYIELCGEMLDVRTENMIRNAFHVQTANVYATQMAGAVAASCEHGHLHIFTENAMVEVIRDGRQVIDQEGDIYITSLQNTAMPLIRLKTGDRGVMQSASCSCGWSAPVLSLRQARKCSFIITTSGRKISANVLTSLAEYTNEEISRCLAHIRFRQTGCEHMDVILKVKPAFCGWEDEVIRIFLSHINDSELRQMQWNFVPINSHDSEIKTDEQPFFELWEGGDQ